MQKNICSIYQGPSIIFLPYSSHLPGPQMWAMPHHACHHQEVWFEGVGDNSLASALKVPREGYCLTAKVRFEGETEVQGQELSVCFPAHTKGKHSFHVNPTPWSRLGEQAAYSQKTNSENWSE